MERESFNFVRDLIEAERYKNYKKDYWGGADVIFASSERLDRIENNKPTLREQLENWKNEYRLLVETAHASSVIWLIETLKPYIDVDYLSKYEYYRNIGECVIRHSGINNEKDLLFIILEEPDVKKWEKQNKDVYRNSISKFRWEEWYNYGVENSNPFFVKFMTLWIAFNQIYSKYPGLIENSDKKGFHRDERQQIKECLKHDIDTELLTKELFDQIFSSPFIEIFKHKPVKTFNTNKKKFDDDKFNNHDIVKDKNEDWENRIEALFMMIYTVRCNLFHGSKETSNPRDVRLVQRSGEILEIYLEGTSARPSIEYGTGEKEEI